MRPFEHLHITSDGNDVGQLWVQQHPGKDPVVKSDGSHAARNIVENVLERHPGLDGQSLLEAVHERLSHDTRTSAHWCHDPKHLTAHR